MNAPFETTRLQSTLRKMGNSTGMILPKAILEQLGLASGAKIELRVENGEVIACPAKRKVREGWEEDAKRIGAEGLTEEELEWLEFDDGIVDDSPIPPEWLGTKP
jgi:antitoxin MazE